MFRPLLSCIIFTGMALCLACAASAQPSYPRPPDPLGSNPPVFQTLGMVDTETHFAQESDCRLCHELGVPDRHHLLYGQPITEGSRVPNPDTNGDGAADTSYSCLSCHGNTFSVVRDCVLCHTTSPHHTSPDAVNRHCSECHGDIVADFDDGHYIPTYAASLVTPARGLHSAGWNDPLHTDPHLKSDGLGIIKDSDVLLLDTGIAFNFGDTLTRTDPNELRFKPAGDDNDFMIDDPNRSGTYVYHVIFQQGAALGAAWDVATDTLSVTLAAEQTAAELIAAITAAVPASGSKRVRATKLVTDGSGDPLAATAYSDLGGFPLNSRGTGAGACNYCHDSDGALDVNGDPAPVLVGDNYSNHHHLGLPDQLSDGAGGTWRRCNACHDYTGRGGTYSQNSGAGFDLHMRVCEECHSSQSLHNIQADSPADANRGTIVVGGETAGYGHVGRDGRPGDSDCWGCHGFGVSASSSAPFSGPLIPTLYSSDVASINAGKDATVLLDGAALINTANGKSYASDVRLTAADGTSVTLKPDLILDQGSLGVTIPAGTKPGNYKLQAAKGDLASNPAVLSVVPTVTITAASANGPVTITGRGFGGYAVGSGMNVTGIVTSTRVRGARKKTVQGTIISWSDTKIVARFREVPQTVSVRSVFGNATSRVR
ncbi:MAG: hypothetical protein ACYC4B_25880 [Pirellulaceae bacterium]